MSGQPEKPFHPRHLVCPRCGAEVEEPCVFAGKKQELVHCTERLRAIGDPSLRVKPTSRKQPSPAKPGRKKSRSGTSPKEPATSFSPTLF